ncbi:MAG TPA: translation initiation factor IF-2 [Anaerolineae bacterium]|nr:translation initiation factor IF-2 [Anaerolineae bacterium]HQM13795.1 translation initiation factor IF-2 [Anaerolineae bacterium]
MSKTVTSQPKEITIPEVLTVRDLADLLGVSPIQIIKILMNNGMLASINQQIDFDTASIVAAEFNVETRHPFPEVSVEEAEESELTPWQRLLAGESKEDLVPRPPVVTILGHVDHGKTSLLDAIRHANVAGAESGGITQHIGAYQVKHNDRRITFLDTPGHEAFTAMRSRGAHTTDIAVLVVAADDGVQPQTVEAINHARAAHVPIIVALNKIDKPNARPEFVKQELADLGLVPDEWGGDILVIPVSAKKQQGLEDLLEAILLVADEVGVQANPNRPAVGAVLEGKLDKRRGPVATVLVQNGTLYTGDIVVVGTTWGKVRALEDENNKRHRTAPPGTPAVIIGLHDVPVAGDRLEVVPDEHTARAIVQKRLDEARAEETPLQRRPLSLDEISARIREGQAKELAIVLKTDVQGSIEPIVNSLQRLSVGDVRLNIIHAAAGNITESDVNLAVASGGTVLGFRVDVDGAARRIADDEGITINIYEVIYNLIDDVERAMKGLLEPVYVPKTVGQAEVRAVFSIPKVGKVAGCMVTQGMIRRNGRVRVWRGDKVLHEGGLASLKRFEKDVREVREGFDCGIKVEGFEDIEVGDRLECFVMERQAQE